MCVPDDSHSDRRERSSLAAVEQGVELAEAFDATVRFLYVVDVGTEMSASAVGNIADELSEALDKMATDPSIRRRRGSKMKGFRTN